MHERNQWVDIAKGIGIALVVFGHVSRGLTSAGIQMNETAFELIDSVIYSFHMPLFFFLSGLFLVQTLQRRGTTRAVWSKVDTILYPYVLWSILQGSTQAGLSSFTNENYDIQRIFRIAWAPISPFWFLYALFGIFVVAALVIGTFPHRGPVVLAVLAAASYLAAPFVTSDSFVHFFTDNAIFFVVGVLAVSAANAWSSAGRNAFWVATTTAVAAQFFFHGVLGDRAPDKNLAALVLALLSIGAVVQISGHLTNRFGASFAFLGRYSMAIYVMHILAGSGTRVALSEVGINTPSIHLVAGCIVGLFAPVAAVIVAEKIGVPFLLSAPISRVRLRNQVPGPQLRSEPAGAESLGTG